MKIGYYGLGKMGSAMVARLLAKKHGVVASNRSPEPIEAAAKKGTIAAYDIPELVKKLKKPRVIWIMVPNDAVDAVLAELIPLLEEGDTVIDGGNSLYTESIRRGKELAEQGIDFVDVGVSGGPEGAREGACLMVGGSESSYKKLEPLFKDLAAKGAYGYMGPTGAGHFVKMVHNGIEYGMMQSIAEGFSIMNVPTDFNLDLKEVSRVYSHQSVISSRLIDWLHEAYKKDGVDLKGISGEVGQSGEGQWAVDTAQEMDIETPAMAAALQFRKDSKGNPSYTGKILSALRGQFGGHSVKKEEQS
ncbi:MAG: decarboxylating 6-phosphogluconate dehydrogenase [Patescibacteria group bacterium]|nr:decarboxylating 6-phosphogluconate dehydrogenase [bacterium]MDZ4221691.1 decarboxylating 6-phosphogluconate dehydrogenase [Patescibacteria group bacterium]